MISTLISVPEISSWEGKIFMGILGFSWATYMWEEYLSYRQRRVYVEQVVPPKELKGIIEKETYDKARLYGLAKSKYSCWEGAFSHIVNTTVMVCGGIPYLWDLSGHIIGYFGYTPAYEITHTVAFLGLVTTFNTIISLPWSVYFTFVLEEKHGFNKQTPGFFIKDKIKKFIISQAISMPVVAGLVYIIKNGGDYFFFYLWCFTMAVVFFFMTVYPDFIAPLFDKYTPLPDGELKKKIEELAKEIEFPLQKLYVVEGSKRSAHSNAYFYGFMKNKRIVLYDTLLEDYTPINEDGAEAEKKKEEEDKDESAKLAAGEEKKKTGCNTEEVVAVLGHELGHWKLNHVLKNIVISQVNLLLVFSVFGALHSYSPLYRAFGFHRSQPAFIGLIIVMQYVFAPYNELLSFLMTMFSRHNEFEADAFAVKLGKARMLRAALIKLNNDNLGFPVYDHLYSSWHHSHPPILQRINALDAKKED